MAFLTFAEAKVVAPPIVPMSKLVTFYKIIKGSLFWVLTKLRKDLNRICLSPHQSSGSFLNIDGSSVMMQYLTSAAMIDPVMMTQHDAILDLVVINQ